MKPYFSYRHYRRGKNRCLECGMKLDDKKHCDGDHKQIFINVLKYCYVESTARIFKEYLTSYEILSKNQDNQKGRGYYYEIKRK